ncbi:MAG: DNA polymerase III subunit delta [Clostridia bacterium]|nr:DNA polymerase III subunit delta [Clostridia bacterium]
MAREKGEKRFVEYMSDAEIRAAAKEPSGGYFLFGEEDYLKRHYAGSIRRAALADSSLPEMNEAIFDEDSYTPSALWEAIAAPPLMGSHRFVAFRVADLSVYKDAQIEELAETLETLRDYPETVFVLYAAAGGFDAGKPNAPSDAAAALSKSLRLAYVPLQSEARLIRWLERHVRDHGLTAEGGALPELIRLCGREMLRLSSEVEKACVLTKAEGKAALTADIVRRSASRTPEENAFQLANSILAGNRAAALECLGRAVKRAEPPLKLLAAVTGVISDLCAAAQLSKDGATPSDIARKLKMHEYKAGLYARTARGVPIERLAAALSLCVGTEKKLKSSPTVGYADVERLVCETAGATRKGGGGWRG